MQIQPCPEKDFKWCSNNIYILITVEHKNIYFNLTTAASLYQFQKDPFCLINDFMYMYVYSPGQGQTIPRDKLLM